MKQNLDDTQADFPIEECTKNNKKYSEDDFKRNKVIGKGSYGKVYLVRKIIQQQTNTQDEVTGDLFAMKVLK